MLVLVYSQLIYGMSPTNVNDFSSFNAQLTTKWRILFLMVQSELLPTWQTKIVWWWWVYYYAPVEKKGKSVSCSQTEKERYADLCLCGAPGAHWEITKYSKRLIKIIVEIYINSNNFPSLPCPPLAYLLPITWQEVDHSNRQKHVHTQQYSICFPVANASWLV